MQTHNSNSEGSGYNSVSAAFVDQSGEIHTIDPYAEKTSVQPYEDLIDNSYTQFFGNPMDVGKLALFVRDILESGHYCILFADSWSIEPYAESATRIFQLSIENVTLALLKIETNDAVVKLKNTQYNKALLLSGLQNNDWNTKQL